MLRGALVALAALVGAPAQAQEIVTARYDAPTTRYDHGILGDAIEYGVLVLGLTDGSSKHITLPKSRVFEDLVPRVADLDGDGHMEIAYIDRPHLAKLLKIWRYRDGKLTLVAEQGGLTNHRIGEAHISGGIRDCGAGPQLITASADWSQIVASVFDGKSIRFAAIGNHKGANSFKRALDCRM